MGETIQEFSRLMLQERHWSWSVIGILYFSLTLIIRGWFLKPLLRRSKKLKKGVHQGIKDNYIDRALIGWIFYFISFILVLGMWAQGLLIPMTAKQLPVVLVIVICYGICIVFHVQAIGIGAMIALKRAETE